MDEAGRGQNSADAGALRTCLLAVLVGVIAGSLGSAFHYLLEKAFALHAAVAGLFPGDTGIAALAAALLGAAMAGALSPWYVALPRKRPAAGSRKSKAPFRGCGPCAGCG